MTEDTQLIKSSGSTSVAAGNLSPSSSSKVGGAYISSPSNRRSSPSSSESSTMSFMNGDWIRLLFVVCFTFIAGFSNWAVFSYTHDRVGRTALPDILFDLVPEQEWAAAWGDYAVTCNLSMLIAMLVFHRYRMIIARRTIFIAGTLYAMRSVSLLVTQLPPGYTDNYLRCRERENETTASVFFSRLFEQTIRLGFQTKEGMLCGDLLFSGHTLVMMSCTLTVQYYLPRRWKTLALIPYLVSLFGVVCLIISRTHYTIDVIFAYWNSVFIFVVYHAFVEVDIFVERRKSILHSLFIMRIVEWLEEEVIPGRIDNVFALPFENFFEKHVFNNPGHHKQISISSSTTFGLP